MIIFTEPDRPVRISPGKGERDMAVDAQGNSTREGMVEILTELLADLVGTDSSLHLYKAGFSPDAGSVEADFEAQEADFGGYAPVAITWSAVGVDSAGLATVRGGSAVFTATDSVTPNSIGGAWCEVETAPGPPAVNKSLIYFPFAQPIPMNDALAQMAVEPVVQAPAIGGYAVVDS